MSGASAQSPSRAASSKDGLPISETYREQFLEAFDSLVKELTEDGSANPEIADGIEHLAEVIDNGVLFSGAHKLTFKPTLLRVTLCLPAGTQVQCPRR